MREQYKIHCENDFIKKTWREDFGLGAGQKDHGVNSSGEQSFLTIYVMEGSKGLFTSFVNKQDLLVDSIFSSFPLMLKKNPCKYPNFWLTIEVKRG